MDHFTCISVDVIYCITCTPCKKIYIGEAGRRLLGDRFREHLRDVEINDTDALKPVARPFNLPNHFHHNMTISGLSLHHGNTDSRKNVSTGYTLSTRNQLTPLIPLIYLQIYVIIFAPMVKLLLTLLKTNSTHNSSIRSDERANARNVSSPNVSRW